MKNEHKIDGNKAYIYLRNINDWTVIDAEDIQRAIEFPLRWYGSYNKNANCYYVMGSLPIGKNKYKGVCLHRWILGVDEFKIHIDHVDHNPLNNTRGNIRYASNAENQQNRQEPKNNTSGFKGVYWYKPRKKWRAKIQANGKSIHIGLFDSKEDAHLAHMEAQKIHHPFSVAI